MKIKVKLLLLVFLALSFHGKSQCNGSQKLGNKKYNEVAYLTTHNAYNSASEGFTFPNQNLSISEQLAMGVRGFMLDVYDLKGTSTVYHAKKILGKAPFTSVLQDIKVFLDDNPNEVVTIILECYTMASEIEKDLKSIGLFNYLYAHTNTQWPTLQEMIENNTRLVLFTDRKDAALEQNWYHYIWDHAIETHFTVHNVNDFNCDFNRGDSTKELFILNHFATKSLLGTGNKRASEVANTNPFFINRVLQCYHATQKFPNFITVDFVELGNAMEVVNEMNSISQY